MDKLKQWIALTLVGALGILAVGWFLLVSPKRGEATELRAQAQSQVDANALLKTQIEVLKAQATELPKEQATLADVAAKIPGDSALPDLVRALLDASATTGVELVSITPGTPAVVAPPVVPASGEPTTAEGTPTAVAPAPASAAGPAGQLASLPVAINIVGNYFEVASFVAALERLPRAMRLNDLTLAPGVSPTTRDEADTAKAKDGSSLTTTINGVVFMAAGMTSAPAPAAAADPTTAVAPAVATN